MNKTFKALVIASFTSIILISGCTTTTVVNPGTNTGTNTTTPSSGTNPNTSANPLMTVMNNMMAKMHGGMMTGSIDQDFAAMMIEHHKGAVDMANIELQSGKDSQLRTMAENIIKAQQSEIKMFQDFLTKNPSTTMDMGMNIPSNKELMDTMNMTTPQLKGNIDFDFATLMIPHHQSAIDMANVELKYGKSDEIKKMATQIITDQQKEITMFQDWLSKNK